MPTITLCPPAACPPESTHPILKGLTIYFPYDSETLSKLTLLMPLYINMGNISAISGKTGAD